MSFTVWLCAECGTAITRSLKHLEDVTLLQNEVSDEEYDPPQLVPLGYYVPSDTVLAAGIVVLGFSSISLGEVLFNTADLLDSHPTLVNDQDIGCCGYDGDRGYNWFCANGYAIGTQVSDCAMVNYCRFPSVNLKSSVENKWANHGL